MLKLQCFAQICKSFNAENTVGPWKFFGRGRVETKLALIAYASIPYKGSDLLAADHPQQITGLVHIENDDR